MKKRSKIKRKKVANVSPASPRLIIDARREKDPSVLPAKLNGGAMTASSRNNLLTADQIAEDAGGRSEFVNMCRLSEAPEAMEFVRKCEVDKDVPLEKILDSMNVRVGKILGSVVPALVEYRINVGKMLSALHSPQVMKDSIESAGIIGPEGFADRKMQLEIVGIVEKQRGTTIIGQLNAAQGGLERPEATYTGTATRVDEDEDVLRADNDPAA